MIKSIKIENLRGLTRKIELAPKTLITGRNGTGKSALLAGAQIATLGYVPGCRVKSETFANASASLMSAEVQVDDTVVRRTWTKGKSLQETIEINGVKAQKSAAAGMLEVALGKEPPVVDMPGFWAMTDSDKRRMILAMVATPEEIESMGDGEGKAREHKNAACRERETAEKAVEQLVQSLGNIEKPAGNAQRVEAELTTADAEREKVFKEVAAGDANDRARATCEGRAGALESIEKRIADAEAGIQSALDAHALLMQEEATLAEGRPKDSFDDLPEVACQILRDIRGLVNDCPVCDAREEALVLIAALLPDKDAQTAARDARVAHTTKTVDLVDKIAECERLVRAHRNALQQAKVEKAEAIKAQFSLDSIGPGATDEQKANLAGVTQRVCELRTKLKPLREVETLTREIEKARLVSDDARSVENKAKGKLDAIIKRQAEIVERASCELAARSTAVLPYGSLALEDDGKYIRIEWAMDTDSVAIPRTTLSGGEKAVFDAAVGHAIFPKALVAIEAAECDLHKLQDLLEHLGKQEFQVVVCTWFRPSPYHIDGWTEINLDYEAA